MWTAHFYRFGAVMAKLSALIFDVDGTLADTERDGHRVAFNRAFADAGLDWVWSVELYGQLLAVSGGKERIRHYLQHHNTSVVIRADNQQAFIAELHAVKTDHYTRMLSEGLIPMRSGVKRLLQEVRDAGLRLAIATTTTPANVRALLQYSLAPDAADWFEVIAAGDIVPAKKPAPDIYDWTLQRLGLAADACLAVEDSYNGVQSAWRAKIRTILVTTNDYTAEDNFSGASLVVDRIGEPDEPFQVRAGDVRGNHRYVDLALLRMLHDQAGG
jgi:HAD superfamily hydrolase (TIGR01509 family)